MKWKIQLSTFFKKGLPKLDDHFGVCFFCGRQGSGKNYSAVKFLAEQKRRSKIFTNVHSLKLEHVPFSTIDELYTNIEENCIFLIDEVSKKYDRNSRTDTQFYAWLNQSRKRKRIVILITQEWRELPMWLRRPAKIMVSTKKIPLLSKFGIYNTTVSDAENMVFNKDEGEYECPPIRHTIYKRNWKIAQLYDTFEPINRL